MDDTLSRRWVPWAAGVLMSLVMCGGYLLMPVFRGAWQSHYPSLAAQWANDGRFSLLGWFGTELGYEELWFSARVNDASRHFPAGDPFLGRDNGSPRQKIIDAAAYPLMGAARRLLGDINAAWLALRLLCCVAWVVLVFRLCRQAGAAPAPALFGAVFVTGFSYILTLLFLENMRWGLSPRDLLHNAWSVLTYGRTESVFRLPRPGIGYSFLFLAAAALIRAAAGGRSWAAAAGLLGGLLAYVHLDVWSGYLPACWAFAALVSLRERRLHRGLAGAALLATALSLPFLYFNHSPDPEMIMRSMGSMGRQFVPASLAYILIFLAGLRWGRTRAELFFSCMALSTAVMVNHSLILGYRLEYHHWMYFGNIFVFLLALSRLAACAPRPGRWLAGAGALAGLAFLQGVSYAAIHFPFQGIPKHYEEALSWLDRNASLDDVVLSINPEPNGLIPAFTKCKVFFPQSSPHLSDYPLAATTRRFLAALEFYGIDRERFFKEVLFVRQRYGRRDILDTGLKRGVWEDAELYSFLYFAVPQDYVRGLIAQADASARPPEACPADWLERAGEAVTPPAYLWVGRLEHEHAGRCFKKSLSPEREVFRNPAVTLYRYSGR